MFKYLLLVVTNLSLLFCSEKEVRKIDPPKLSLSNLGQKILCHRPMRYGSPNLKVEQRYGKVVANNYGHGDSCWALAPGSADYVNNLLIDSEHSKDLKKDTPITIIGGGAIGLFAAYDLLSKGFKNITIISETFNAVTSHISGGLVAPSSMDNDSQVQKIIYDIGIKAYSFYRSIAEKKHHYFTDCAVILPAYFENRQDSGLEPYVGIVMKPAKDVVLDFGNGTTRPMVVYDDSIFVDTEKLMNAIMDHLKKNNVKFVKKKIKLFSEIPDKFIINCIGIGAKELSTDDKLVPVQGHLIMLKNQNPDHLKYIIIVNLGEGVTRSGQKVKRMITINPKHLPNLGNNDVGMIGSTFIVGATSLTPNNEEFDIIYENAKKFFGRR